MVAFGYVRQSRSDDDSPAQSPLVQEERIRALAKAKGDDEIVMARHDLNVSGGKAPDARPGFAEVTEAIRSGECSSVYAYDLSRLFRNLKEQIAFFELTQKHGVPVRFVEGDVGEVAGATGELMLTVLGAMNEWQRKITSEKIRASLARIERETGRRNGAPKYGGKPGEDPDVVVAAFREAGSFGGAAKLLNVRGVPCRVGKARWSGSVVASLVRRHAPDEVPPPRGRGVAAGHGTYALSQLLVCSVCAENAARDGEPQSSMYLTGSFDKRNQTVRYECTRARHTDDHGRAWITESKIMPLVREEAQHVLFRMQRTRTGNAKDDAKRDALDAKRSRWLEQYADGLIDRAERDRRLALIAEEESRLSVRRWVTRFSTFPLMVDVTDEEGTVKADPPGAINAYLTRLFERVVVDMSQPTRRGPNPPLPAITFTWRDPSLRGDTAA